MNWFKTHAPQLACLVAAATLYVLVLAGKLTPTTADEVTGGLLLIGLHLPKITYPAIKPPVGPTGLLALVGALGLVAVPAVTACNASAQQLQATADDSLKVGACILSDVLGGQTDPLRIGADCAGALPALIVQVIDDFTAPKADAAPVAGLSSDEGRLLADAKSKAMARLAAESKSP